MMLSGDMMLLVSWGLLQLLSVAGVIAYWRYLPGEALTETAHGVVAIIPVKGPAPSIDRFVEALLAQSVALRTIFVVASKDDSAWSMLNALAKQHPDRLQLTVAGLAMNEGQKIHNILAAVAKLTPDDRYLIFLDADMLPGPHVVGRLLFPLVRGKTSISTGYRWLAPSFGAPASWLGAAINLQVATLPRLPNWNLPWGGATAMSRETFERLNLAQAWRGALSDDLMLFRTARRHNIGIRAVRDLLLPSQAEPTVGGLWRFGVRQYRHLFWNVPEIWMLAATILGLQSIGWTWTIFAGGWWAILIGYGAAILRAGFRFAIARRLPEARQLRPVLSIVADMTAPFLVCWIHLLMILAAASSRRISWAGIDYWMKAGKVGLMNPARPATKTDL